MSRLSELKAYLNVLEEMLEYNQKSMLRMEKEIEECKNARIPNILKSIEETKKQIEEIEQEVKK